MKSTADRLMDYREAWRKHFAAQRSPKAKQHPAPSNGFPREYHHMTDRIYREELASHNRLVANIATMKATTNE